MKKQVILSQNDIENKIERIAFQILETFNEEELVLAGISKNGYILATLLAEKCSKISDVSIILCEITIDKRNPNFEIQTSLPISEYQNKNIVLVDDVLNTGSTLIYGVKHFLEAPVKKIKTAVLVDRNHKNFPIKVDFKGISLSTSLQEHVFVSLKTEKMYAELS
jgi:pyrimidine operon attenuation protein/uracil phosphoribosyltransferase